VKLVAGLGNPGAKYRGTRHNVGFEVIDRLVARHGLTQETARADALQARWRRADGDVLLVKPLTFMNVSGVAVGSLLRFYKIAVDDAMIVCDDVNLPLGRLRIRATGTEGGHNGLRSIAQQLGTIDYARLRVGVGRGDSRRDLADHVLATFEPEEAAAIEDAIARSADAVETWLVDGLTKAMNTYNREPVINDGNERERPGTNGNDRERAGTNGNDGN
jgi:peptidyl-tRNA hydrolase, PTH1 family